MERSFVNHSRCEGRVFLRRAHAVITGKDNQRIVELIGAAQELEQFAQPRVFRLENYFLFPQYFLFIVYPACGGYRQRFMPDLRHINGCERCTARKPGGEVLLHQRQSSSVSPNAHFAPVEA